MAAPFPFPLLQTGRQTIGAPRPTAMPTARPTPSAGDPSQAGLLDRLRHGVSQLPFKLMPQPRGTEGLLTLEDLDNARRQGLLQFGLSLLSAGGPRVGEPAPSLGQALAQAIPAGQQAFQSNAAMTASGALAARTQAGRERVAELLRNPSLTPDQRFNALQQMMAEAYANGDLEALGALSQVVNAAKPDSRLPQRVEAMDAGDHILVLDPATGMPIARYPKGGRLQDEEAKAALERQRAFQNENRLATNYDRATRDMMDAYQVVGQTLNNVPLARSGNGAAQVELLYGFVKALDPASVVREGEVALAQQAATVYARAKALADKYAQGEAVVVPPDLVDQIADLMRKRMDGYARRINRERQHYINMANRAGIPDPEILFLGPPSDVVAPEAQAAPRGSKGNAGNVTKWLPGGGR